MSLLSKEPPYSDAEIESIAQALLTRRAIGGFITDPERKTNEIFGPALARFGVRKYLDAHERGLLYLFEFSSDGQPFAPGAEPRFSTCCWAAEESTRRIVQRTRELEFMQGLPVPLESVLLAVVARSAKAQREALPRVRRQLREALAAGKE